MELSKEQRKERIAELRKHHEKTFEALGIPNEYYCCKVAHYAKIGDTVKVIGLYPSECEKGDDVYVEFCTHDYTPVDPDRRLYVWVPVGDRQNFPKIYDTKKSQYLIPVSELKPVFECKLPVEGNVFSDKTEFSVLETVSTTYVTTRYKSSLGANVEVTYKNGIPHELSYHKNGEQGFRLSSPAFGDIVKLIKHLI